MMKTMTNHFDEDLKEALKEIEELLLAKNKAYGNSALDPVRIFSKASNIEQLNVRIDDKLSRLAGGLEDNEDVILDLIGYLLIYRIQQKRNSTVQTTTISI